MPSNIDQSSIESGFIGLLSAYALISYAESWLTEILIPYHQDRLHTAENGMSQIEFEQYPV
jgi:hypothetical protein